MVGPVCSVVRICGASAARDGIQFDSGELDHDVFS
jgi:hypothetical protein